MNVITRYYNTLTNLKPIQIRYRLKYIIKRKIYERFGQFFLRRFERAFDQKKIKANNNPKFILNDRKYYQDELDGILNNKISFLNKTIQFEEKIDWHKEELDQGTRLWKLNLNYHEFLFDVALEYYKTKDQKYLQYIEKTILEWFEQNPLGTKGYGKDNWNSYSISLRVVSWIKIYNLISKKFSREFESFFIKYLWIQLRFLSENLELDILGNHLIKNWKALIWGRHFFATNLFDKAIKLTEKYVYSQFSEQGMHEENAPMYAGIVLEDLMEVYLFQKKEDKNLESLIQKQYQVLTYLTNQDQYLFFNDSVNKNGVQFSQLTNFYGKVFPSNQPTHSGGIFDIDGFVGFKTEKEHLVFDCADVVAGNQPGHVHCDALSFEYFRNAKKIFTNSGTFEYNLGSRREYSRSSESHNVLKYGQFNQSEVWSSFRMGRRASVKYNKKRFNKDDFEVVGSVKGHDFSKSISHQRKIIKQKNSLIIEDTLRGNVVDDSNIYFHITPELTFKGQSICCKNTLDKIANFEISHNYKITNTEFYPEFGLVKQKETLVIEGVHPTDKVITKIDFYE